MTKEIKKSQPNNVTLLSSLLNQGSVKGQLEAALKENAGAFTASVVELFASDKILQSCDPQKSMIEVLKAATLKLPLNKNLGMAYIVPFKDRRTGEYLPQFQLGYKGYIQLAMRTGQYRFLNADKVLEGQLKSQNPLTGEIDLTGEPISDEVVGYFAYMELLNGFSKAIYWTKAKVDAHANRYSASFKFNKGNSIWTSNFDEMALKTVTKYLLSTYGILTIDMVTGLSSDANDFEEPKEEIAIEANQGEVIDIVSTPQQTKQEGPTPPVVTEEDPFGFDGFTEAGF